MKQRANLEYWNKRAIEIEDDDLVTHRDLFQKKLELELVNPHLNPDMHVLEVGCGNGFVTEFLSGKVAKVDAFDISEEMVNKARARLSLKNNCRFFVKALPEPSPDGLHSQYDAVLSVRVLINLPSIEAQSKAIDWIAGKLRRGGQFLLLEGNKDGLEALNTLRISAGLGSIKQAPFNINMGRDWLEEVVLRHFDISFKGSIGSYDFLTRYFYPLLVGEDNVEYNTDFHRAAFVASKNMPSDESMCSLSRLHVYSFVKR